MSHSISAEPPKLAATGAGVAATAAVAVGAGAGAAAAALLASTNSSTEPSATLSPTLIFNSFTTPAVLDGISMLALSDSTVISDCSTLMVSPTLTSNSITSTSLKSPISGTLTSLRLMSLLRKFCYSLCVASELTHRLFLGSLKLLMIPDEAVRGPVQDEMQGAKRSRAGGPARLCNAADRLKWCLHGLGGGHGQLPYSSDLRKSPSTSAR